MPKSDVIKYYFKNGSVVIGFDKEELNRSEIYISENRNIDIAIIKVDTSKYNVGYISDGDVLDDIIVMGYPSLPGFENFVTGEKAIISAESKINLPTKGSITSYSPKTVISKEYSSEWTPLDEPYYPINDKKNNDLYEQYKHLANQLPNVIFAGRLAEYKYYDMDGIIENVLSILKKLYNYK